MKKALSYTLIFIGIQVLITTLVAGIVELIGNDMSIQRSYMLIISSIVSSTVCMAVFLRFGWAQASPRYLQSRPWGVLFWSILSAISVVIPSMAFQEQLPELPNFVEQEFLEIINQKGGYFAICLMAPLAEEVVFRGAILRALLAWKPQNHWAMIAISALLFALIHMNPAQMPHAFAIGLLFGWMFYRTNSIVPSVAFHWTNNTIAYLLTKFYPNPDIRLVDILGNNRAVGAAIIFSLFILLPSLYQLWLRMKRENN